MRTLEQPFLYLFLGLDLCSVVYGRWVQRVTCPQFSLEIRVVGHASVGDSIRHTNDGHWRHSPLQGTGLSILKFDFNSVVVEKHSQSAHDGLNFRRV